jgi:hypothetical protein
VKLEIKIADRQEESWHLYMHGLPFVEKADHELLDKLSHYLLSP